MEDNINEIEQLNSLQQNKETYTENEGSNDISLSESCCSVDNSTSGSLFWIPIVPDNEKPKVGTRYPTLQSAIEMYSNYAEKCGFDIRLSTQKKSKHGQVKLKYILCNKAYASNSINIDTLESENSGKKSRNVNIQKTDCKASIKFTLVEVENKYEVYYFEEKHNHELVPIQYRHLLRKRRQLDPIEESFIHRSSTSNIGATRAHNLLSNLIGSRDLVHGTVVDFKNFRRDLNLYAGENDGQMLVNKMKDRTKHRHDFSFTYRTEKSALSAFFWADETAKWNYKEFGDILSFDATYDTNRYKMVFVPFTGVDNHRKCVTFGAGMLTKEDTESYKWLLDCFLKAFKKEPLIVVTDQDPAMKKAIEEVFTVAKHRLCMWHITDKLPAKICSDILENTQFRKIFNKLVWNIYMGPVQFEEKWRFMLEEFDLKGHKWLHDMYQIRERWIPAYFKNVEMCGLMRTSSRSESENAFFSSFTHHLDNLLQFMNSFDAAMEKQRYIQEGLDHKTMNTVPKYKTQQKIERHASNVYTRTIFKLVQNEIVESIYRCSHDNIIYEEGIDIYTVKEKRYEKQVEDKKMKNLELHTSERLNHYKVLYNRNDSSVVCTCELFQRLGILCRHIFYVYNNRCIEVIPREYVKTRWTKNLIPADLRKKSNIYTEKDLEVEKLAIEGIAAVDFCIRSLINDKAQLKDFVESIKKMKKDIEHTVLQGGQLNKKERFESILGVAVPEVREIENPSVARNKGWASGKRIIGEAEKSKEAAKKKKRRCKKCGKTNHNSRTCKEKGEGSGHNKQIEDEDNEIHDLDETSD